MNYINTETGEDDLSEAQVRAAFPNTTFCAADFPPAPYAVRVDAPAPSFNASTQDLARAPSVLVDGVWTQQWSVVNLVGDVAAARLAVAQTQAWERIKAERDRLSDTGGYLVGGKWFHSDAKSKTQQLALVMMGASVPAVQWKTMDGTFTPMSQALAMQIFQAAAAQDMALFSVAESHRTAVLASADPSAYDFSAGWPAVFTG